MAKMTPEQEAAYALDFGVARSGLPPEARHRLGPDRGRRHSGGLGVCAVRCRGCGRADPGRAEFPSGWLSVAPTGMCAIRST